MGNRGGCLINDSTTNESYGKFPGAGKIAWVRNIGTEDFQLMRSAVILAEELSLGVRISNATPSPKYADFVGDPITRIESYVLTGGEWEGRTRIDTRSGIYGNVGETGAMLGQEMQVWIPVSA